MYYTYSLYFIQMVEYKNAKYYSKQDIAAIMQRDKRGLYNVYKRYNNDGYRINTDSIMAKGNIYLTEHFKEDEVVKFFKRYMMSGRAANKTCQHIQNFLNTI